MVGQSALLWDVSRYRKQTHNRAIPNLQGLDDVQEELRSLVTQEQSRAVGRCVLNLKGTVNGRKRGCEVGKDASHSHDICLPRHALERESILDGFLRGKRLGAMSGMSVKRAQRAQWTYQICLDASHHVCVPLPALLETDFPKDWVGRRRRRHGFRGRFKLLRSELLLGLWINVVNGAPGLVTSQCHVQRLGHGQGPALTHCA